MKSGVSLLSLCACLLAVAGPARAQQAQPGQQHTLARFEPPYRLPSGVVVEADAVFASPGGRDLRLDLFRPAQNAGSAPVVLFIQGSARRKGS